MRNMTSINQIIRHFLNIWAVIHRHKAFNHAFTSKTSLPYQLRRRNPLNAFSQFLCMDTMEINTIWAKSNRICRSHSDFSISTQSEGLDSHLQPQLINYQTLLLRRSRAIFNFIRCLNTLTS